VTGGIADLTTDPIVTRIAGHRAEFLHWGYIGAAPWRNYLHRHAHFEVCYAHSGRGTFRIGTQVRPVGTGDIFIARPGDAHEIISGDDDPLEISFWSYTLLPDEKRAGTDSGRDVIETFAGGGPAVSHRAGSVPALLSLLDDEATRPMVGRHDFVANLAGALVLATARAIVIAPAAPPLAMHEVADSAEATAVRGMLRYLHDNYEQRLSVAGVAAEVRLSPRHASRLFARGTGISITAYLQRLRLTTAAQRLVEHELSVKEIAHRSGYSNVHYFTTAFRQQWSQTPAAFRRQNGRQSLDSL
jgi:AraC family L-rhamnose operon transcriptional activator RhaR